MEENGEKKVTVFFSPSTIIETRNDLENSSRVDHIHNRLLQSKFSEKLQFVTSKKKISKKLLKTTHTSDYVDSMLSNNFSSDYVEETMKIDSSVVNASRVYAQGVIDMCKRIVVDDKANFGCCVGRPPGHHASADYASGYCVFNHVGIAGKWLKNEIGKRVLIVDWDAHHGQGTQDIFYEDDGVMYFSTHRVGDNVFPGLEHSDWKMLGDGLGYGTNINIPFQERFNNCDILYAFEKMLVPLSKKFKPDVVLVSCGFDGVRGDPYALGGLSFTVFNKLTTIIKKICPKIVFVLEGGYDIYKSGNCMLEVVSSLVGIEKKGRFGNKLKNSDLPEIIENINDALENKKYRNKKRKLNEISNHEDSKMEEEAVVVRKKVKIQPPKKKKDEDENDNINEMLIIDPHLEEEDEVNVQPVVERKRKSSFCITL